jgi:hypothetical protein
MACNAINIATMVHADREVKAETEQHIPSGCENMLGIRLADVNVLAPDGRERTA